MSLPLLGIIHAAGLTIRQLESLLDSRLLPYIKEPHASVLVSAVESHPISVMGEVNKPGTFQVREPETLLQVLSLGQGLAPDAGDEAIVIHGTSPAALTRVPNGEGSSGVNSHNTVIKLADLLDSTAPTGNILIYPGDVVEVTKAGIVYVVGSVKRPGGFVLKSGQSLSVLQAVALAEGVTNTSAKNRTRIIRTDAKTGQRSELPVNLNKVFAGKITDPTLKPGDIVFIPDSSAKGALYRGSEAAITTASGVAVWRF